MRLFTRLTTLVALLVLVTVPAFAQGTSATLTGTVTSDGKPLPGATITVSSPALQGTRTAVSGSNGDYSIAALPPGSYTVVVELEGMSKVTAKKQLTLKTDSGEQTSPVQGKALTSVKAFKAGDKVVVTCKDKADGTHEATIAIKKAPAAPAGTK